MKRFFFPVWCKGSIGDSRSPDAGSSPAAGSIDPHGHARHTPRIAVLTATLGLLTASLAFTVTTALAEPLPDGRVYEKVTPTENYDADVYVPRGLPTILVTNAGEFRTALPFQVAEGGRAVAYVAAPTVNGSGHSVIGGGDAYLARWSAGSGWEKPANLQPLGEDGAVVNSAFYQAFSPELTVGILQSGTYRQPGAPLLSSLAPGKGYTVLYTRALGGREYLPFFTSEPSNSPAAFETSEVPEVSKFAPHQVDFAGGSVGDGRLLFEANGAFGGTGAVEGGASNNLYESVGGQVSLVNVLPGGGTEADATFGAEPFPFGERAKNQPDFSNVISEDGSRVFWTDLNGEKKLFVSEGVGSPSERSVQVDASQVAGGRGGGGRFWTASKSGSRVFFTDSDAAGLTADTQSGSGENLYVYEVGDGQLTDLTPAAKAEVEGVIGEGEDNAGKYTVYFVAKGVLAENKNSIGVEAEEGVDNLYMLEEGGRPTFVAAFTPADGRRSIALLAEEIGEVGDWQPGLGRRTAEVTPDGGSVVFMSDNQKFDGHYEEAYAKRLEEVYVYDAASNELSCASCARDGLKAIPNPESIEGSGPDGELLGLGAFLPISNALTFQPTLISEDGSKVFFDSDEPLVTGDTNGEQDVYEWERDGSGGCGEAGGCVYLLSGGAGTTSSWLVGGDASGNNVFFVTRAQLVAEDGNENYDLYDARVNGIQPVLPPACSGTGCQGIPAQAPTFATPSSVTFEGVGNFAPPAETPAPMVKPKPKTKPKAKHCRQGFVKRNGKCARRAVKSRGRATGFSKRHVSLWRNPSPGAKFSTKGNYAAGAVMG